MARSCSVWGETARSRASSIRPARSSSRGSAGAQVCRRRYGARMTNKRALITGCSTGIGRATAVELTDRGYDVIATARRPETLDGLKVTEMLALDVDDEASIASALKTVGAIDVLV